MVGDQQASSLGLISPGVLCQVIVEIVPAQFPVYKRNTIAQRQLPSKLVRSARNGLHAHACQVLTSKEFNPFCYSNLEECGIRVPFRGKALWVET